MVVQIPQKIKDMTTQSLKYIGNLAFEGLKKLTAFSANVIKSIGSIGISAAKSFGSMVMEGVQGAAKLEALFVASEMVFGEYSSTIENAAKNAGMSMGIMATEFTAKANTMGMVLRNTGMSAQSAAEQTVMALSSVGDLAIAKGRDASSMAHAIQNMMQGNTQMLQNMGFGLSAIAVESFAADRANRSSSK